MNIALIFAGGIGRRMNSRTLPKQFLKLYNKEIIVYTMEHFEQHPEIDGIVVACLESYIPQLQELVNFYRLKKVSDIVPGGATSQQSIYNGLKAAERRYGRHNTNILVHDGVRPLIDETIISGCISLVRKKGCAITVAPAIETIMHLDENGRVDRIIDRSECQMARAPQAFRLGELLDAHERSLRENLGDFIDSATLMQYYGHEICTVEGPVENIKITTPMDYYTFRALYEARENAQLFGSQGGIGWI